LHHRHRPSGNVVRTNEEIIRDAGKRTDRVDTRSVAVAQDGRIALSGEKLVRWWDLTVDGPISLLQTFMGMAGSHIQPVASVAIAPDGRTGLSGSQDYTLKLWDLDVTHTLKWIVAHLPPRNEP
jgi:WD40 repeat protein